LSGAAEGSGQRANDYPRRCVRSHFQRGERTQGLKFDRSCLLSAELRMIAHGLRSIAVTKTGTCGLIVNLKRGIKFKKKIQNKENKDKKNKIKIKKIKIKLNLILKI
jgi:hypothetical protein